MVETIPEFEAVESATDGTLVDRCERELRTREASADRLCLLLSVFGLHLSTIKKPTVSPCGEPTSQSAERASDNLQRSIRIEARNCDSPHGVCIGGVSIQY